MADDLTDPYAYGVSRRNAEWADTFSGGTTNLAQRRRHVEDQEDYRQREIAMQRQALEQEAVHNKTVQSYLNGKAELELERSKLGFQQQMASELHQLNLLDKAQDIRTSAALEKERLQTARLAKVEAEREADDTTGFAEHMATIFDRNYGAGKSPDPDDLKLGAIQGMKAFPHAKPAVTARYQKLVESDDDLTRVLGALPPDVDVTQLRRGATGKWGVVAQPKAITQAKAEAAESKDALDTRKTLATDLRSFIGQRSSAHLDDDQKALLDRKIIEIEGLMGGPTQPAVAVPAVATTAPTAKRMKFVNGKLVPVQ